MQYDKNEAAREFAGDLDGVYRAAEEAAVALGFLVKEEPDEDPSRRSFAGDDIRVDVESFAGGTVEVRVRIGTFDTDDHERRAELFLEETAKRL
ncbi:MAG: hypothetical protein AB1726_03755 [Planctomycetota bacterium]